MTNNSKIFASSILLILALFFHLRLFTPLSLYTSQDVGRGDLTHFNYPLKDFYAKKLKSFELPLWTDQIFTGFPILAESQVGTFYLPNLILFYFLPTPWAFNLSFVLSYFLAGLGVYFYCRYLKLDFFPSIFAAVAFAFSMVFTGRIIHLNVIQSASLIPWILYFSDKLVSQKSNKFEFLALTLILSQQVFAGFMQIVVYTLISILLLIVVKYFNKKIAFKSLVFLVGSIALAFLISAIQILPTLELRSLSFNPAQDNPREWLLWLRFKIHHLLLYLDPYLLGDPSQAQYRINRQEGLFWEQNGYLGVLPLIFAFFSFFQIKKQKEVMFNLIWILFWLIFSLGWMFFIYLIPPVSFFRIPQRSLIFVNLSLSFLSAFGGQFLLNYLSKKVQGFQKYQQSFSITLIILAFSNLYFVTSSYNGVLDVDRWLKKPETVKFLDGKLDSLGRIYSVGQVENWKRVYYQISQGFRSEKADKLLATRSMLDPNSNMVYEVPSADGYAAIIPRRAHFLQKEIKENATESRDEIKISTSSAKILTMQGVQYLISSKKVIAPGFIENFQYFDNLSQNTYLIYQNINYKGRIYPVSETKLVLNDEAFAKTVNDPKFLVNKTAMVEAPLFGNFSSEAKITDIKSTENSLDFKVKTPSQALIVLADSFYPGWKAEIDKKEVKILPVNINSRGIVVPSGTHQVNFSYQPMSLRNGAIVSLLSLIGLVLIMVFWRSLNFLV